MNRPSISIIIPVRNGAATIGQTIEACLKQDYAGPLEIIVVDDGSTDKTAEIVEEYVRNTGNERTHGSLRLFIKRNPAAASVVVREPVTDYCLPITDYASHKCGPAAARNLGWQNAGGEIVFFTDADCVPPADWVSKVVSGFSNSAFRIPHSSLPIGAVGGGYAIANPESWLAACIQAEMSARYARMPEQPKFLSTHNLAVRRDVLEQIDGFNESFQNSSAEDNDLVYRIGKAGYSLVLQKETKMSHYHQTNLRKYLRKQFQHAFWRMKLYLRHPDMIKGDDYTSLKDAVEPFLALFILALLPITSLSFLADYRLPVTGYRLLVFVCLPLVAWQLLWAGKIAYQQKSFRVLFLSVIGFLRSFARGLGMAYGVLIHLIMNGILRCSVGLYAQQNHKRDITSCVTAGLGGAGLISEIKQNEKQKISQANSYSSSVI